jgi:hypothetical protein
MESTTYVTSTPLTAGSIFPSLLSITDSVLNYINYYIEISSDQPCKIYVYQCSPVGENYSTYIQTTYSYSGNGITSFFVNKLTCSFIGFQVQNTSQTNQTFLNFSVVYK